jgi:hypothetical protein
MTMAQRAKFLLGSAFLLFASTAFAADAPHKIDFTVILLDADNEPMQECAAPERAADGVCKEKRTITLGAVAMRALTAPEQGISGEDSLKRGQLALGVYRSPGAELTAEEIALIKKQVAKFYSPLVVARAFPLLDPAVK